MSVVTNTLALGVLLKDAGRSVSELEPVINKRLNRLLVAASEVPRHRDMMREAGYDPRRDFSGLADLNVLPVMTKADLKRTPEAFVQESAAGHLDEFFKDRTSGSTGMPLSVYRSSRERDIQIAKWLRVLFLNGYRPTDKVLSYTSPGRLAEGRSILQLLGLLRRRTVDYTLPPENLADEVLHYRPDVVYGVRTSLLMVAEELERRGIQIPPLRLLVAGGEVIDAHTRQQCRKVFGTDITETYGTVEMGVMAYQARGQVGLSLIEDCTLFEFLDEKGKPAEPGQLARVIVTDLHGGLMPFIRYEQGDLATYSLRTNEYGETVRVIDRIIGRQDDIAHLPDGRFLTYLDFYEVMDLYPGIQRFRIRQQAPDRFLIDLVATPEFYYAIKDELMAKLLALSQLHLHFEIRLVEKIDPDPSGKRRMLVSDVMK